MVETSWVEPADGVFVYRRGSQNKLSIVRLHLWTEQEKATIVDPNSGPYWSLVYGLQRMGNWQPSDEHCAPTGMVLSADGPLCDRYLREEIVGRVIGVLGDEARTLNWRA